MSQQRNAQRHERLKELMITKIEKALRMQSDPNKKITEAQHMYIDEEVEHLLRAGDASESSLKKIAAQARTMSSSTAGANAAAKPQQSSKTHGENKSKGEAKSKQQQETPKPDMQLTTPGGGDGISPTRLREHLDQVREEDLWAKMLQKDVEQYNKETLEQRRKRKKKEEEQRLYLDAQVAKRREIKSQLIVEEKKYAAETIAQEAVWKEETKKQHDLIKQRHAEEKKIRNEQLAATLARKEREAEIARAIDIAQAQKIKEEYEREQQVNLERRIKAKQEVAKAQQFNIEAKKVRQEIAAKEAELDKLHQAQFLARLEKQERERDEGLLKMQERQKKQHAMVANMERSMNEVADEDEKRAQAYLARRAAKQDAEARAKEEKLKHDKAAMQQYLTLQMIHREEEAAKRREELQAEAERMKKLVEEDDRKERERRLAAKEKALQARRDIERQMAQNTQKKEVFLTETERKLNAKILQEVEKTQRRR